MRKKHKNISYLSFKSIESNCLIHLWLSISNAYDSTNQDLVSNTNYVLIINEIKETMFTLNN